MKTFKTMLLAGAMLLSASTLSAYADDVTIGLATAQTGGLAFADQPSLAGFKMAIDEINAKGGFGGKYKATLDIKDTRTDTAATV